jgi:DNA repair exonuclease SbcCD ATPase subunit
MQVSNWIIFGAAEVFGVLILVCAFLLFHARGLKTLISRLQEKLAEVIKDLKKSRKAYKELKASIKPPRSYSELVDEQLQHTRDHHASLDPDQDIVLDLTSQAPMPRQIASLRHAFLMTEKEASLSSDDPKGSPNWNVIQAKFSNLMNFFKAEAPAEAPQPIEDNSAELEALREELEERDQRIANLEKFKQLFFELEDKWDAAQAQADDYHQQLSTYQVGDEKQAGFEGLLSQYRNVYNEFGGHLQQQPIIEAGEPRIIEKVTTIEHTQQTQGAEEIQRLRSITANQHQLINELESRLSKAHSNEEKVAVINDLQEQLQRQQRNIQEFETCIELMESELQQANNRVEQLESQLSTMEKRSELNAKSVREAKALQQQRAKMERSISTLKQENEQLVNQLQAAMTTKPDIGGESVSQELKQLQRQYTELESKYLALRMKS